MGATTAIEWTDHTFNPWIGCTKVHTGCTHCYAETLMDPRWGRVQWGPNGTRQKTSDNNWQEPLRWNKRAEREGVRRRVFCASLADVFEDWQGPILDASGNRLINCPNCGVEPFRANEPPLPDGCEDRDLTLDDLRRDLFAMIDATPHLDWLLLTKRPENVRQMWATRCYRCDGDPRCDECRGMGMHRSNVWLLTSISDQKSADAMVPELLKCRDLVPVLGVSAEPLLGPIDLSYIPIAADVRADVLRGIYTQWCDEGIDHPAVEQEFDGGPHLDLVIIGGESGPKARPCRVEWIRDIVQQCKAAAVPVFVKQMGTNVVTRNDMVEDAFNDATSGWPEPEVEYNIRGFREDYQGADCRIRLRDIKGGDPAEWPQDLRLREFPQAI